ncbi:proteasome ATPase [Egibacter rhizosphaerae]|uniref:AAA ATPase forming ring-shaped complexes n=1 Tax=Egibacter rhizosphaerae TaxID=1670831 RepID=A0A411YKL1_9ACTN|nr:proteasome ATPase [Egibacter rhizosphaerae]QBI21727.1 proteasome ATPase [Egibacter rhizosphaerae]
MADQDAEVAELREQVNYLQEEAALLRRRLEESPQRVRALEERVLETKAQLSNAVAQNQKLADTLREAREQIVTLKEQVEKLSAPPSSYGVFLGIADETDEGYILEVFAQGRKLRVNCSVDVPAKELQPGQEVVLNEALNVVLAAQYESVGEVMSLKERLDDDRLLVINHTDDEQVVRLAEPLQDLPLRAGDSLLVEPRSSYALERLPRPEVEELVLEEIPDIDYTDIGGLGDQIEAIQDAVELPFVHADLFREHHLTPPKGILLYGPPGCGKTMIAKAVASSLAGRVAEKEKRADARSYFLNIKGPELLNKYVGETERQIRLIFQRAREKVEEGHPVIVFFDEMDSIFRTRGSGVSSDVENTIVPQLLSEIDGVETLEDVIVIGASNREDMIDPAILRPGRLDVKIKIERPDELAAREIFKIYLHSGVPLHPDLVKEHGGEQEAIHAVVTETCRRMYAEADENRFLEVTYANGDKEILYFKDFNSGAMIENVVARAKKAAIKRYLDEGQRGIKAEDLYEAVRDEFKENEDLPNTTNPDDWARISGKKGERIVYVRTLIGDGEEPGKSIENINTGQYL